MIQNVFILDEAPQFVENFIRLSTKYADLSDAIRKKRDLPLSEVTAKNYHDMDIEQLLETISFLESRLEAQLDIDTINLLMNLYQKVFLNKRILSLFLKGC